MNAMKELERLMEENKDVLARLKNGEFKCPLFDLDCPYCLTTGECTIGNPMEECDDYYYYNADEEEEE